MKIAKDRVVSFHYRLTDLTGNEIESSHTRKHAQSYLHGHGGLIPGLEKAMADHEAGDKFEVVVPPEDAYGPRQANAVQRVSRKKIQAAGPLKVGGWVTVETSEGRRTATVQKIGMTVVDLDLNHPLAGQSLNFAIEIIEVRDAQPEELSHGHAHGVGGAQH